MDSDSELLDDADIIDMVWAETNADFIRHSQARAFFMNRLCDRLRKEKRFSTWTFQSGIFGSAAQLRDAVKRFDTLKRQGAPIHLLRVAQAHATAQANIFVQDLRLLSRPLVTSAIDRYAQEELRLEWEWLRFELYRAWLTDLISWITNKPQRLIYQPIPRQEPAPQVDYHFQTRPGESFPDMLARFKEDTERFYKEQADEYDRQFPKGTTRKDQDVDKYVEWFFRLEVVGEPLKRIAKYDDKGKERSWSQQPKDIKKYAQVARNWLELGFSQANLIKSGWGAEDNPPVGGEGS